MWQAPVNVPFDGAWLVSRASNVGSYMDCFHRYAADLVPNFSQYASPLFQLGVDQGRQEACLGSYCYSCYTHWGGQITYTYHTTTTNPGFLPPGGGVVGVRTLTGGGTGDTLSLYLAQVNRDVMESVSMFLVRAEDDPVPLQPDEINAAYFIANSADRVPVVLEFRYGTDYFPAGPGLTYSATWDGTTTVVPAYNPGPLMPLGYSILGVPIPKLPTGKHKFTVKATLPGGKAYTTDPMDVFVYAQNIYVTVEGSFAPKATVDQAPQFIPGSTLSGGDLDLTIGPQIVQLNILVGRGSSGTFDVRLKNVTHYPGVAMNYPADAPSPDPNPDIDFGGGAIEKLGVTIPKGGAPKVVTLPLYIRDYAASATVEVTMPYRKTSFVTTQILPIDRDNNSLPDAGWYAGTTRIETLGMQPGNDGDALPAMRLAIPPTAPNGDGDNLTNFEEYRGFVLEGQHQRFNPGIKDFVVDVSAFGDDLQFIPAFFPASAHAADPAEYNADHEINGNSDGTTPGCGDSAPNGHHFQTVKRIVNGGTAPPVIGLDVPRFGDNECYNAEGPCVPNNTGDVIVYIDEINARAAADGITDTSLVQKLRRNTVVHESGHATNLYHVTNASCIMYGAGFTLQGAWTNIPQTACTHVTTTVNDCPPCGPTLMIENIPDFNETDSLRVKPQL